MMLVFLLIAGFLIYTIYNKDVVKYLNNKEKCDVCKSIINSEWEYCPFCGNKLK